MTPETGNLRATANRPKWFAAFVVVGPVVIAASVLALVTGCETAGVRLEPSFVSQIHAGQTRAEVSKLLGSPNSSKHVSNDKTIDVYWYDEVVFSTSSASSSARDLSVRTFSIRYDPSGQVEKTFLYQSLTPVLIYHSSALRGTGVTADDASKIRVGVTTREELEHRFGKPLLATLSAGDGVQLDWYRIELGASVVRFETDRGLHALVDNQGIVRAVSFSDTTDRR